MPTLVGSPQQAFFRNVLARVQQYDPQGRPGWKEENYQKELCGTFKVSDIVDAKVQKKGCDIEVRWMDRGRVKQKIAIEVKFNLSGCDILVGQLEKYAREYNGIIVVLLGRTREEDINRIKRVCKETEANFQIPTAVVVKRFDNKPSSAIF